MDRNKKANRKLALMVIALLVVIFGAVWLFAKSGMSPCVEYGVGHIQGPDGALKAERICICEWGEPCSFMGSGSKR